MAYGQSAEITAAPLKTKNAYRTLPLSADAIDVLIQQKEKSGKSEWVFPSPTGGPMSPDSVLHRLQRILKRAGLPRIRFHDLRHTFATMALQNGVDVKTVLRLRADFQRWSIPSRKPSEAVCGWKRRKRPSGVWEQARLFPSPQVFF